MTTTKIDLDGFCERIDRALIVTRNYEKNPELAFAMKFLEFADSTNAYEKDKAVYLLQRGLRRYIASGRKAVEFLVDCIYHELLISGYCPDSELELVKFWTSDNDFEN